MTSTTTFAPGDRVTTPDGPGAVTEPPFLMSSGWTVPVKHDAPVSASGEVRYGVDEVSAEPTATSATEFSIRDAAQTAYDMVVLRTTVEGSGPEGREGDTELADLVRRAVEDAYRTGYYRGVDRHPDTPPLDRATLRTVVADRFPGALQRLGLAVQPDDVDWATDQVLLTLEALPGNDRQELVAHEDTWEVVWTVAERLARQAGFAEHDGEDPFSAQQWDQAYAQAVQVVELILDRVRPAPAQVTALGDSPEERLTALEEKLRELRGDLDHTSHFVREARRRLTALETKEN